MERVAFLHGGGGGMTAERARAEIGESNRLLGAMRRRAAGGPATGQTADVSREMAAREVGRLEARNRMLRRVIGGPARAAEARTGAARV